MTRCQFCDQRNSPSRRHCEKCGAELPTASAEPTAAAEPAETASGFDQEILDLLQSGGKIAAVKRYREETGLGLKESKDAVERLAGLHGVNSASGSGCGTAVVAVSGLLSIAIAVIVTAVRRLP